MTRSLVEKALIAVALAQAIVEVQILGRWKPPELVDPEQADMAWH